MLGLGEPEADVLKAMDDLRAHGVQILTLGQYLQPSKKHLPVVRFVTPEEFERYRGIGTEKGFLYVASGPLVRSSYRAGEFFIANLVKSPKSEVRSPKSDNAGVSGATGIPGFDLGPRTSDL